MGLRSAAHPAPSQSAGARQGRELSLTPPPARAGAHVLCLGAGSGILPMMTAQCGADKVTACERSRSLYRMAKHALDANRCRPPPWRVPTMLCGLAPFR